MGTKHASALTRSGVAVRQSSDKEVAVVLRSFAAGGSGRLNIAPSTNGGRVRLTALGLPTPQRLTPTARLFVVWAVAPGGQVVRVGELKIDSKGNGGVEFSSPTQFARYSVIVTAESAAEAVRPLGVPVL